MIYGWDDGEDDELSSTTKPIKWFDDDDTATCGPEGVALAESISYNREKVGSLARLAVVFSPPERALQLEDIESIELQCVTPTHIDIRAMICEDGGCVSLQVPVKFPNECIDNFSEGCVLQNIDVLDEKAHSMLSSSTAAAHANDDDDLCAFPLRIDFPDWWVPPECDASLVAECRLIQTLLNEADFQPDVQALAQQRLAAYSSSSSNAANVLQARVAAVGPAGLCLQLKAVVPPRNDAQVLDVLVPFGGEPTKTAEELRAAVLGAVASS